MKKVCSVTVSLISLVTTVAASTSGDVLYVATPQASNFSLVTYNVNPATAVAKQVGNPVTVGTTNVDPVTVGSLHVIYVWDANNVWLFITNAQGVPQSQPSEHLNFNFAHTVNTFLADPDGKFAFAG